MTHFVSTTATESICPRCKRLTLTALDEGLRIRVDHTPLPDRQAEIAALLAGRATYTRLRGGDLVYRSPERITANTLTGDIHAEHKCERPAESAAEQLTLEWSNK